jgi:hypothetical protein
MALFYAGALIVNVDYDDVIEDWRGSVTRATVHGLSAGLASELSRSSRDVRPAGWRVL